MGIVIVIDQQQKRIEEIANRIYVTGHQVVGLNSVKELNSDLKASLEPDLVIISGEIIDADPDLADSIRSHFHNATLPVLKISNLPEINDLSNMNIGDLTLIGAGGP